MGTLLLSKSAVAAALDAADIALLAFGIVLVIGLLGEYSKSEKWQAHKKLFEMLVILGVAGELLADGGIFLWSKRLQAVADTEIAGLKVKAATAEERSKALEAANLNLRDTISPLPLPDETLRAITEDLRPLLQPGVKIRVVGTKGPIGMSWGIQIFGSVEAAGFKPQLQWTDKAMYGIAVSGSRRDWETFRKIENVFARHIPFVLPGFDFLPPGSPITISVGEKWMPVLH
jgi:hypothetical protein